MRRPLSATVIASWTFFFLQISRNILYIAVGFRNLKTYSLTRWHQSICTRKYGALICQACRSAQLLHCNSHKMILIGYSKYHFNYLTIYGWSSSILVAKVVVVLCCVLTSPWRPAQLCIKNETRWLKVCQEAFVTYTEMLMNLAHTFYSVTYVPCLTSCLSVLDV